jgi:hypothetical protein
MVFCSVSVHLSINYAINPVKESSFWTSSWKARRLVVPAAV